MIAVRKKILFKDEEISLELQYQIETKRLREGCRLPSERQLAEEFGVQRNTVRSALGILLKKGVLVKKPRQGYFVAPKRVELNIKDLSSIKKDIADIGNKYRTIVLNFEKISLDRELAEKTGLPEGSICYQILRLRYDEDRPISIERSYLIADRTPDLTREEVTQKPSSSILRQKYGISLGSLQQKIAHVYSNGMESVLLKTSRGEPLIRYEGMIYDKKGCLVEFFNNVILADGIEFRVRNFA